MTIAYFQKKTFPKNKVCSQFLADRVSGGHKRWAEGPTGAGADEGQTGVRGGQERGGQNCPKYGVG